MFDFVLAESNLPFAVSLGLMFGIAILEGTMTLLGAGMSEAIDSLLPESLGDADIDVDVDAGFDIGPDGADIGGSGADFGDAEMVSGSTPTSTPLSSLLGWLCVGKVPVLILLVVFLTGFGISGLAIQSIVHGMTGAMLPGSLASIPALVIAVPTVRVVGTGLAKLIPKDETSAVTTGSFVGRVATITLGTAESGRPAEAKLKDAHGQVHYVMVEPYDADGSFDAGTQVLIVEQSGPRFRVVLNTSAALVDE